MSELLAYSFVVVATWRSSFRQAEYLSAEASYEHASYVLLRDGEDLRSAPLTNVTDRLHQVACALCKLCGLVF